MLFTKKRKKEIIKPKIFSNFSFSHFLSVNMFSCKYFIWGGGFFLNVQVFFHEIILKLDLYWLFFNCSILLSTIEVTLGMHIFFLTYLLKYQTINNAHIEKQLKITCITLLKYWLCHDDISWIDGRSYYVFFSPGGGVLKKKKWKSFSE